MKYEFLPEAERELYEAASRSLTEVASPTIGGRASKTADKLFGPTCAAYLTFPLKRENGEIQPFFSR